jgi:anti-sigma B factor antagonist
MGKLSMGSKSCFVTAVPQVTRASFTGGPSMKYAQADWDCTSFTRPWTPLSSPARVQRIGCASLSIWPTEAVFSEGDNTVQISARRHDKTTIFDLSGDIDFANSPKVRDSVLREIRESRAPRVMVNLSQVRYMDSSGVASLVEGLKASRDLGSRFILVGLSRSTRDVLQLSRLIKVFEVYDNEEQAMAS